MSPHEAFYSQKPDMRGLRTWGCLTHVHIMDLARKQNDKLETRVRTCILLGYAMDQKGF
jgi:hypothetical protein